MQHSDVLSAVDLLLALDAHGSATRAAAALETTPATVLRRLEKLEAELGVRFFDRHATGLKSTPAFALVRPWAEQAQAAASGLLRQLTQIERRPAGVVRLATPPAVANLFVVPSLPELRREFPELVVELIPGTALVDLAHREADIAIRTVRPTDGGLVLQRLSPFRLGVFGAPGLKALRDPPRTLVDYPWIGWSSALASIPEAQWLSHAAPEATIVFRSSELGTLISAAQAGIGAVVVADVAAEAAGGLVPLPVASPPMPEGAIWLVAHEALRPVPRVAAVWDWLVRRMSTRTKLA